MYPKTPKTCVGKVARPAHLDWFWNRTTVLDYDDNEAAAGLFFAEYIDTDIALRGKDR